MEGVVQSYHRDKRLSVTARSIMAWILGDPSEVINPASIASENDLTVKYVRSILALLAKFGYLIAPKWYKNGRGCFEWTAYTLPPQPTTAVMATSPQPSTSAMDTTCPTTAVMDENPQPIKTVMDLPAVRAEDGNKSTADHSGYGDQSSHTYTRDAATRVNKSVKAKAKGKSKKQKDKKISPVGESVPVSSSDSPEKVTREMQIAVCDVFNAKPGGYAGRIGQQLLGTAPDGKRHQYNITPAMTAFEVVAFGLWYRETYPDKHGGKVYAPSTAETLSERVQQFRDDTTKHAKKMALAEQRLARLVQEKTGQGVSLAASVPAPREREGTLKSSDMEPVREDEVEGYVKAGLMTADEMPRPTMKTIYDRLSTKMGSKP